MDKHIEFVVLVLLMFAGLAGGIWLQIYLKPTKGASVSSKTLDQPKRVIRLGDKTNAPLASYLKWPITLCWLFAIGGIVGGAAGSGGSPAGFAVAIGLNPVIWAAIYCWSRIGDMRCPHCRGAMPMTSTQLEPVGAVIECQTCHNFFSKPPA